MSPSMSPPPMPPPPMPRLINSILISTIVSIMYYIYIYHDELRAVVCSVASAVAWHQRHYCYKRKCCAIHMHPAGQLHKQQQQQITKDQSQQPYVANERISAIMPSMLSSTAAYSTDRLLRSSLSKGPNVLRCVHPFTPFHKYVYLVYHNKWTRNHVFHRIRCWFE